MTRLVNYGSGEIADRLTILALKILAGTEAGKDITHFRDERNVLLVQLRGKRLNGGWTEGLLELAAVNAALWHAEDGLRAFRTIWRDPKLDDKPVEDDVVKLAFRIQALNDQRAAVIQKLNKDSGDGASGPEKL